MESLPEVLKLTIKVAVSDDHHLFSMYSIEIESVAQVLQFAGIFFFLVGMIGKFGAILVLIPDPVVGGLFCVMFGMIAAVGLSNLQHANLNSSR